MEPGITIITADRSYAAVLTTLGATTFLQTFEKDNSPEDMAKYLAEEMNLEKITDELNDPANTFYLALSADSPVGFAKVRGRCAPSEPEDPNAMEIERLYVLQAYHGHKIGAALMQHCLDHARAHGYTTVWLGVWEYNHKAIAFYRRWGFAFFGSHSFWVGNDEQTDLLMKKQL